MSKKVFTIPNVLSLLRILLAPLFVVAYFNKSWPDHIFWAIVILVFSGLTDVVDGIVARRFNMITELGQVLDPVADKLTQGAVVISLAVVHPQFVFLFILLAAKELSMLLALVRLMKAHQKPIAAQWWGKVSTVVVFCSMALTLIFYDLLKLDLPDFILTTLIVIAGICLVFSLFNYYPIYKELENDSSKYGVENDSSKHGIVSKKERQTNGK